MKNHTLRSKIVELFDTQRTFAQLVSIDETTLSRIIKGRRKPTYNQVILFVHLLKTPKERLFNHANILENLYKKKRTL